MAAYPLHWRLFARSLVSSSIANWRVWAAIRMKMISTLSSAVIFSQYETKSSDGISRLVWYPYPLSHKCLDILFEEVESIYDIHNLSDLVPLLIILFILFG